MVRLGLLIVVGFLVCGCASSGKIVVQDGYRGIAPAPPACPPEQPGGLTLAPSPPSEIGFKSAERPFNP